MEQKIGKRLINQVVRKLPRNYIATLASMVYGSTDKTHIRRIKYWRSGAMKTAADIYRIYYAALKLTEQIYDHGAASNVKNQESIIQSNGYPGTSRNQAEPKEEAQRTEEAA